MILTVVKYGFYFWFSFAYFFPTRKRNSMMASNLTATLILRRFLSRKFCFSSTFSTLLVAMLCGSCSFIWYFLHTCTNSLNSIITKKKSHANTITCHTNKPTVELFPTRHRVFTFLFHKFSVFFFFLLHYLLLTHHLFLSLNIDLLIVHTLCSIGKKYIRFSLKMVDGKKRAT